MENKYDITEIISDISRLNNLDGKNIGERVIKYGEEYGEFSAELGKLIGITHKPYDEPHLKEEMADALQCLLSIYLHIVKLTGFELHEVLDTILVKNKKWEEKLKIYTNLKNNTEVK